MVLHKIISSVLIISNPACTSAVFQLAAPFLEQSGFCFAPNYKPKLSTPSPCSSRFIISFSLNKILKHGFQTHFWHTIALRQSQIGSSLVSADTCSLSESSVLFIKYKQRPVISVELSLSCVFLEKYITKQ